MGMDIVHAVLSAHVCINVYLGFLPYSISVLLPLHHLGHYMWLGYIWKVVAVGNPWGSATVLCWEVMDCQL